MNRFLIFALLSVCVCAELFKLKNIAKRPNFIQRLNDIKASKHLKRQNLPELRALYGNDFYPASPACNFVITVNKTTTYKDDNEDPVVCSYKLAKSGYTYSETGRCNDSMFVALLVRNDLQYYDDEEEEQIVPVAQVKIEDGDCDCDEDTYDLDDVQDLIQESINNAFGIDYYRFKFEYDSLTEEIVDGDLYYVFSLGDEDEKSTYYVDKNKFIVKYIYEDEESRSVSVFNYDFNDNLDKNLFKLDESLFPNCCTNESFKKAPEKLDRCWYAEYPDFEEFEELAACNLSVDVTIKINDTEAQSVKYRFSTTIGEYGVLYRESSGSKLILRRDLVDRVFDPYPIFTATDGMCNYSEGDSVDWYYHVFCIAGPFMLTEGGSDEPFFYKEEDVSCGKSTCTKYCLDDSKAACLTFKNTKTHDIVGFDFSTSYLFEEADTYNEYVSIQYSEYKRLSNFDVFKLDKEKYPGCQEHPEAYEKPNTTCLGGEGHYFTPTPLPCSFVMTVHETTIDEDGETYTDHTLAFDSDYVGIYYEEEEGSLKVRVLRGDLGHDQYENPYVETDNSSGSCYAFYTGDCKYYFSSQIYDLQNKYEGYYERRTTVTIDNVVYTVYNSSDEDLALFVDSNGLVARVEFYDDDDGSLTGIREYKYKFDNKDKSIFKLDNETFPCQSIDDGFYKVPALNTCNTLTIHDPSQHMCAFKHEITIEEEGDEGEIQIKDFMIYFSSKNDDKYPIIGIEDRNNESKVVFRTDLPQPPIFDEHEEIQVISQFTGINSNSTCSFSYILSQAYTDLLTELYEIFMDKFTYVSEEQVACGTDKCTRYCEDMFNSTCIILLNSEPRHILKYETEGLNITYGVPIEVKDINVFTLDKNMYPGCDDHPKAYEKPKIKCSSDSSMLLPSSIIVAIILAVATLLH